MSSVQDLLNEAYLEEAIQETDELLLDTADALTEALAEATALEVTDVDEKAAGVDFDEELESYQFHNQDYLSGLSSKDLDEFNPDNHTDAVHTKTAPVLHGVPSLVEYLLSEEVPYEDEEGLSDEVAGQYNIQDNSAFTEDDYPLDVADDTDV